MGNTVFIMGAGASHRAGVPLMSNFLDEARKLYANNLITESDKKHFGRVFKGISALQATHSKSSLDINNLESVFATFEMAKRLDKMPSFDSNEIDLLIASMKRLIVVTIEKKFKVPQKDGRLDLPEPYNGFGRLINRIDKNLNKDEEVSLLTFNYDIALDLMLAKYGIGQDYCLINSTDYGQVNAIKLLKLHGSINWGIVKLTSETNTVRRIRPYTIDEFTSSNSYISKKNKTELDIGSSLKLNPLLGYQNEPVIVPPTWNKSTIHDDMLDVWREASKQLEKADDIFIIGFSMPETDIFFKHLYALGTVGKVPLNRFWVFDPDDSGKTEKRYRDLLGVGAESRFDYKEKTFKEAIDILNDEFNFSTTSRKNRSVSYGAT